MLMTAARPRYLDMLTRLDEARSAGVVLGLDRTRAVLARLNNPQRRFVTVQIAGTNGKGSTAAMTEAILRASGLRTGLYTSPHLSRFTERIRVDGREADGDHLALLDQAIAATGVPLTYFEIATVLAFLTFAEAGVRIVVAETGLGGRLDATTTCDPVATAITSIAWDHAEWLGSSLAEIAAEKAGIAKPGVPLFLAPVPPDADAAIARIAARVGAPLRRLGTDFQAPAEILGLRGAHQTTNAALAVALADAAARAAQGGGVEGSAVAAGLRDVRWPGRLEWVAPDVLLDCAHNAEGAAALAAELDRLPRGPRALLFSVVAGKPAAAMLRMLVPRFDAVFVTESSNPRSVPAAALREIALSDVDGQVLVRGKVGVEVTAAPHAVTALTAARAKMGAGAGGLIVGAGSTFLVGDLRAHLLGEARDPILTSDPLSRLSP
jgi:dihydrofolate synthase/folylpolyglutamate synthase